MRIGECLKLKVEDVDLTSEPARINIRGEYTKTGNPRVAFISSEAKEALEEWLKIRENEIFIAVKRSTRYEKKAEDRRIWPFETNTAYYIWRSNIKKAKFDEKYQYNTELENNKKLERFTVHPHVLRKFFRTKMGQVIPVDVTEALMGHEGYLTEVYRRYSLEDLAKYYKQGEHTLTVFGLTEANKFKELEEANKAFQTQLAKMVNENEALKAQINDLKNRLEKVEALAKQQIELYETMEKLIKKLEATHPEWLTEA
jgi:cell division protein FtsB